MHSTLRYWLGAIIPIPVPWAGLNRVPRLPALRRLRYLQLLTRASCLRACHSWLRARLRLQKFQPCFLCPRPLFVRALALLLSQLQPWADASSSILCRIILRLVVILRLVFGWFPLARGGTAVCPSARKRSFILEALLSLPCCVIAVSRRIQTPCTPPRS